MHTIGKRMAGLVTVIHLRKLIKKKTINFPYKKKGFWFIVVYEREDLINKE
ncbi:MAG: hypothetical protein KKG62_06680 [Actinobacteria bacterium]|nr:hypothetical protein [Actinomycetota bacterium]